MYLWNSSNLISLNLSGGFPGGSVVKNPPTMQRTLVPEVSSIPGSGRSPREGNGNPLQYSCLRNPMVRGAWQATVHGVAKHTHTHMHTQKLLIWKLFFLTSFCLSNFYLHFSKYVLSSYRSLSKVTLSKDSAFQKHLI